MCGITSFAEKERERGGGWWGGDNRQGATLVGKLEIRTVSKSSQRYLYNQTVAKGIHAPNLSLIQGQTLYRENAKLWMQLLLVNFDFVRLRSPPCESSAPIKSWHGHGQFQMLWGAQPAFFD